MSLPQVGEVRLVDGRFTCRLPPSAPLPPAPPGGAAPPDLNGQMTLLAILMLMDLGTLKGHQYKVRGDRFAGELRGLGSRRINGSEGG